MGISTDFSISQRAARLLIMNVMHWLGLWLYFRYAVHRAKEGDIQKLFNIKSAPRDVEALKGFS